jgi:hypothetical protein
MKTEDENNNLESLEVDPSANTNCTIVAFMFAYGLSMSLLCKFIMYDIRQPQTS